MSRSFSNNVGGLNMSDSNSPIANDLPNILSWPSPLDPKLRHQDMRDRRVENVGEWLLQNEEFKSWCASSGGGEPNSAVLFCYRDPEVGKFYISTLVIDILCHRAGGRNAAAAYYYFDFAAQKEQSPASIPGTLLKQPVFRLGGILEKISRAYRDRRNATGRRGPRLSDLVKMLKTTSSKKRTFICIDALDECVAEDRVKLLASLSQILRKSPGTRVFVTGRPHILPEIGSYLARRVRTILSTPRRDDVIWYLHIRLNENTAPDAMDSSLEADILEKIPEDISEIFQLALLNIDAILQETTIHSRRQKLDAISDGLGLEDAYNAMLGQIKGQGEEGSRRGMAALMWISHSERPLKANELCHALAVEIGSPNINTDNVPTIGRLLAYCQGLVAVDKEVSTVRLIHPTLQEYLLAHPELSGTAHSTMAETCLSYLNLQQVKTLSASPSPNLQDTPLLVYSALYWGIHATKNLSDCAKSLALKLFGHLNNRTPAGAYRESYTYPVDFDKLYLFSGLHCASFLGISKIVADLVEAEGCDINQKDYTGNTPLMWAAYHGHERVGEILLGRGDINPEKTGSCGETPLCCAALNGHEGLVKMLLGRDDVDPNRPDRYSRTPLYCATRNGHTEVVKILLERDDIDPNKQNDDGETPLHCAAWYGRLGAAKLLLERDDVDLGRRATYGRTLLHCATRRGHKNVAALLRSRGLVL